MNNAILLCFVMLFITTLVSIFENYTKRKKKIDNNYIDYLPGKNCGDCGFNSCLEMIKAMEKNKNEYLKCKHLNDKNKEIIEKMIKES